MARLASGTWVEVCSSVDLLSEMSVEEIGVNAVAVADLAFSDFAVQVSKIDSGEASATSDLDHYHLHLAWMSLTHSQKLDSVVEPASE